MISGDKLCESAFVSLTLRVLWRTEVKWPQIRDPGVPLPGTRLSPRGLWPCLHPVRDHAEQRLPTTDYT